MKIWGITVLTFDQADPTAIPTVDTCVFSSKKKWEVALENVIPMEDQEVETFEGELDKEEWLDRPILDLTCGED